MTIYIISSSVFTIKTSVQSDQEQILHLNVNWGFYLMMKPDEKSGEHQPYHVSF